MPKHCAADCLWTECGRFCSMLSKASVPLDEKWPVLVLYLRGIKEIPVLSENQKARMQELLLIVMQQKDFSDARYQEVQRMILEIINAPFTQKLKEIARETSELAKDMHTMFGKHTRNVSALADSVDTDLASGVEPASLLADLRDTLKGVVAQMEQDASTLISLSHKDSLTGLANRRAFDIFLTDAVEHWQKSKTPVTLILFDIDHFKMFNDTYGHLVGDQILQSIGAQIQKISSSLENEASSSLSARYGGEEFALILCGDATNRAGLIADNLRKTVQKTSLALRDANDAVVQSGLRVTVSVGVASLWSGWKGAYQTNLVDATDKALYFAKNNGRNCTAVFSAEEDPPYEVIARD